MSVVVETPDNRLMLYVKGADSVVYERLWPDTPHQEVTKEHMKGFANEGLRTLVLGERELSRDFYEGWKARYVLCFAR